MHNKKVLITGASGFIGSFLVEEALAQGFEVYACVRKTSIRKFLIDNRIKVIELNLLSEQSLRVFFETSVNKYGGFDYVIHNAGITQAMTKSDFIAVNYQMTCNLVNSLRQSGVPLKKFVFISSLAAYGPGDKKTFDAINSSCHPNPISSYGFSKLMAEQYVRSESSFPFVILNPTAVYGPRDKDFLNWMKIINQGLEFYIGRHGQMLSLIFVKDLARAAVLAMKSEKRNCSYLVSDGMTYDREDVGSIIKKSLGKKTIKIKLPALPVVGCIAIIELIMSLFGKRPFINIEKINELTSVNWKCQSNEIWNDLGTLPEFSLQRGVEETVSWYKKNGWLS